VYHSCISERTAVNGTRWRADPKAWRRHSRPRTPAFLFRRKTATRSQEGTSGSYRICSSGIVLRPFTGSVMTNRWGKTDSNWRSLHVGKGYGEPLQESIAVSGQSL